MQNSFICYIIGTFLDEGQAKLTPNGYRNILKKNMLHVYL